MRRPTLAWCPGTRTPRGRSRPESRSSRVLPCRGRPTGRGLSPRRPRDCGTIWRSWRRPSPRHDRRYDHSGAARTAAHRGRDRSPDLGGGGRATDPGIPLIRFYGSCRSSADGPNMAQMVSATVSPDCSMRAPSWVRIHVTPAASRNLRMTFILAGLVPAG